VAGSVLIDTNVLVHEAGIDGGAKARRADALLRYLDARRIASISTQVLCEYSNTMLRKLPAGSGPTVGARVTDLCEVWPVIAVTGETVIEAVRGVMEHGMSYYDAQIWATARLAGLDVVLSEDFADGREIEGVRFVDPFSESFDIAVLAAGPQPRQPRVVDSLTAPKVPPKKDP
jgi:predicted nucleic acid-binding protein